ncbi:hypothetical protein [Streptomyces sp. ISL-11]|uniref:hypothetical protein n=1 Tax=Streptomyces sp. ISL-11 TaxID=2819174 RepID=UPI001BEADBF7|nr:hypothetical protein [Streptomyces sp. ISL-11]MBT2385116.1 hypothetical protein [Streptomyces sp. ISL-11]
MPRLAKLTRVGVVLTAVFGTALAVTTPAYADTSLGVKGQGQIVQSDGTAKVFGEWTCSGQSDATLTVTVTQAGGSNREVTNTATRSLKCPQNLKGSWTLDVPPPAGLRFEHGSGYVAATMTAPGEIPAVVAKDVTFP